MLGNRSEVPTWKWVLTVDDSSDEHAVSNFLVLLHSTGNTDYERDDIAYFWEGLEAPLPSLRTRCNFIHPRQLNLPLSSDEIVSGFEDSASSGTDQFTALVKMDPHNVLLHHMVDVRKATADFRKASERWPTTSSQTPCPLSNYNWNPVPRRGKEDAFDKQIVG